MKQFFKRNGSDSQMAQSGETSRVVRLRRAGLRLFSVPRPRLVSDRARTQGWLRLSAD